MTDVWAATRDHKAAAERACPVSPDHSGHRPHFFHPSLSSSPPYSVPLESLAGGARGAFHVIDGHDSARGPPCLRGLLKRVAGSNGHRGVNGQSGSRLPPDQNSSGIVIVTAWDTSGSEPLVEWGRLHPLIGLGYFTSRGHHGRETIRTAACRESAAQRPSARENGPTSTPHGRSYLSVARRVALVCRETPEDRERIGPHHRGPPDESVSIRLSAQ